MVQYMPFSGVYVLYPQKIASRRCLASVRCISGAKQSDVSTVLHISENCPNKHNQSVNRANKPTVFKPKIRENAQLMLQAVGNLRSASPIILTPII